MDLDLNSRQRLLLLRTINDELKMLAKTQNKKC